MSIFGKQLQEKIHSTDREMQRNLRALGDSLDGKKKAIFFSESIGQETEQQIREICRFLRLDVPEKPGEDIETILRASGAIKRMVELGENWWKDADGPLLARFRETGRSIALFPDTFDGYYYTDPDTGVRVRINKRNKDLFEREAYCFYKPLPNRPLTEKEYIRILLKQLSVKDVLILVLSALFITLLGMVTPFANSYAFSSLIPSGNSMLLIPLGIWLTSVAISTWMLRVVRSSVSSRINNRLDVFCNNAVYGRVIRLPASFFKEQTAGGMAQRVQALSQIPALITDQMFGTFMTVLLSLTYVIQLFTIAKPLVLPVLIIYIAESTLFVLVFHQSRHITREILSASEKNSGLVFSFLAGIQKIKISGSENKAFTKWLESYTKVMRPSYAIRFPASFQGPLVTAVHILGTLWLYLIATRNHLSVAQFTAFSSAFGMAMSGVMALHSSGSSSAMMKPIMDMGEPILQAVPETGEGKHRVGQLSGKIELNHVSFRYTENGPLIMDDLSLQIDSGEYVAVVGKSGCGKSTLMRLLLGFEEPQRGNVIYDGLDMNSIDRQSLRRNIGTVLQDGQLFNGDIFYNILITAPWLTMKDAWEAADKAGVGDDIRKMPMGMHTLVTESGGGISGGQKQRILIARAICPRPAILFLDEATSALDNVTQKIVTDSMNSMKCTRIVIAHRLSTIRECSRILVLDHGKIVEDGTYDELYQKNGLFTELVQRQIVEDMEN